MARLLEQYNTTVADALKVKFGVTNKMSIPRLEKVVINMGVGRATQDKAVLEAAVDAMTKITGQKPQITKAKTSVAGFRLREGNDIGCKVTLRGKRMYEFLDRLITIALPRIRDFRGVNPNSFDGHGNYTLGLAEQVVFPEIDADRIQHTQGMDITIVTSTDSDDQARELLRALGLPYRAPKEKSRLSTAAMTAMAAAEDARIAAEKAALNPTPQAAPVEDPKGKKGKGKGKGKG
jgi:large subunit ribosomal protein L5